MSCVREVVLGIEIDAHARTVARNTVEKVMAGSSYCQMRAFDFAVSHVLWRQGVSALDQLLLQLARTDALSVDS